MNLLDDFTKVFVAFTAALWGFATFEIASSAYRETAWLFAFAMTIPLAIIVQQYVKSKKKKITQAT